MSNSTWCMTEEQVSDGFFCFCVVEFQFRLAESVCLILVLAPLQYSDSRREEESKAS